MRTLPSATKIQYRAEKGRFSVVSVGNGNDRPMLARSLIFCVQQAPFGKCLTGDGERREPRDCSVLPLFHSDGLSALPMTYLWSSARCVICERVREEEERNAPGE